MRLLGLAGLAGACLATSAYATDLFESAPPPIDAPQGAQQEIGSNWYIRGDVGYGDVQQASVVPQAGLFPQSYNNGGALDPNGNFVPGGLTFNDAPTGSPNSPALITRGNVQSTTTPTFDIGFGYRVNDWLRVDATYSFFRGPGYGQSSTVYCPEVAQAVNNTFLTVNTAAGATNSVTTTTVPAGYVWDATTCQGNLHATQYNNLGLASAYLDLGHWWGVSPYIGAGVGLNVNTITGGINYTTTSNGQNYAGPQVNGTAPATWVVQSGTTGGGIYPYYSPLQTPSGHTSTIPIGPQNWNRTINQTKYTIAGQLMAGVGIPISQSATLDLGYRVLTTDITGGVKGLFQSVNLGVRYNIN